MTIQIHPVPKFPECSTCINRELDPARCRWCNNGTNFNCGDTQAERDAIAPFRMQEDE